MQLQRLKLREHQKDMMRYAFSVTHPALFADPRTGKTIVTVRRCKTYADCHLYLISGPYSVLEAWQSTLADEGEDLRVVTGEKQAEADILQELSAGVSLIGKTGRLWVFTNKESHLKYGDLIKIVPWDVVIIDESTSIKSPKTKISKYYTKNFRQALHRWILTGTPAPETELEYYQQLKFLNPEIIGLPDFYTFRRRYFIQPKDPQGQHEYYLSRDGKKKLTEKLAKYVLFVTQKDAGITSRKIFQKRVVLLPDAVRKMYDEAERLFILRMEGVEYDRTIYSMETWIWMRRMCGGWLPQMGTIPCNKLDDLADFLTDSLRRARVIIWSVFLEEIKMICDRLKKEGFSVDFISGARGQQKRIELRQAFAAGKIQILVCQPECFRHGVNLSDADALIYYSIPAGLETYLQSLERATHMTKKKDVLVVHYATKDTVEADLLYSLSRKEKKHEQTRTIVRAIAARQALRVPE